MVKYRNQVIDPTIHYVALVRHILLAHVYEIYLSLSTSVYNVPSLFVSYGLLACLSLCQNRASGNGSFMNVVINVNLWV